LSCRDVRCDLQVILHMLLVDTFDMDLLETASSAFFALICSHRVCSLCRVLVILPAAAAPVSVAVVVVAVRKVWNVIEERMFMGKEL